MESKKMINSIILTGRLVADPEVKNIEGKDSKVCNISIAVQ